MKLSRIAMVPQEHRRPCLILNLLAQPDSDTPSVKDTTNREAAPDLMQFGRVYPCILQTVWETTRSRVRSGCPKLDVTDACHRGTVKPLQVEEFA